MRGRPKSGRGAVRFGSERGEVIEGYFSGRGEQEQGAGGERGRGIDCRGRDFHSVRRKMLLLGANGLSVAALLRSASLPTALRWEEQDVFGGRGVG